MVHASKKLHSLIIGTHVQLCNYVSDLILLFNVVCDVMNYVTVEKVNKEKNSNFRDHR